jgi:hypothetical protein
MAPPTSQIAGCDPELEAGLARSVCTLARIGYIDTVDARTTIPAFDAFLAERRLTLRATVIGGAALQLMGVIARPTKDCDVLDPALPAEILRAADEFAARVGEELRPGWFNNGPASLLRTLPPEWADRRQPLYSGAALVLLTLAREDLLRSKLFALVDRNIDLADCVALAPTREELHALLPWLDAQDGNEQWPEYVRIMLGQLAQELGHEP